MYKPQAGIVKIKQKSHIFEKNCICSFPCIRFIRRICSRLLTVWLKNDLLQLSKAVFIEKNCSSHICCCAQGHVSINEAEAKVSEWTKEVQVMLNTDRQFSIWSSTSTAADVWLSCNHLNQMKLLRHQATVCFYGYSPSDGISILSDHSKCFTT